MAEEIKKTAVEIVEENLDKLKNILIHMNELLIRYKNPLNMDEDELKSKFYDPDNVMARLKIRKDFEKITDFGIKNPDIYLAFNPAPKGWNECGSYVFHRLDGAPDWVWMKNYKLLKKFRFFVKEYKNCIEQFNTIVEVTSRDYQKYKKWQKNSKKYRFFREEDEMPVTEPVRNFNYFDFKMTLIMDPAFLRDLARMSRIHKDISDLSPKEKRAMKFARTKIIDGFTKKQRDEYDQYCEFMKISSYNKAENKREEQPTVIYHSAYVTNDSLRDRELSKSESELDYDDEYEALIHLSFKKRKIYEELLKEFE